MESTFFDSLSIWIRNKELLENIDNNEWKTLQEDIIENVFGGFDFLLNCLLKNKNILNVYQHNKLYQTLDRYTKHDDDNDENNGDNINSLSIKGINDDCLLYIARFLNENERYNMKQCCRLFTLTIHQEIFMKKAPYIDAIIKGIESNDNDTNIKSLQLYNKYKKNDYNDIYYENVKRYNNKIFQKFIKLIMSNKKNQFCQEIAVNLLKYKFESRMIPLAMDMLNEDYNNNVDAALNAISSIDGESILKYVQNIRESIPNFYINKMKQLYSSTTINFSVLFLKYFVEHKQLIGQKLLISTDNTLTDGFNQIMIHHFKILKKHQQNAEHKTNDINDETLITNNLTQNFIEIMIEMIKDNTVSTFWENMDRFFNILYEYAILGDKEALFLINQNMIKILADFALSGNPRSPYYDDTKEYPVMGSRSNPPKLNYVIQIICHLLCKSTKSETNHNKNLNKLNSEDAKLVDSRYFLDKIIQSAHYNKSVLNSVNTLIAHWSSEDDAYCDWITGVILEGIDKSGADQARTYLFMMRQIILIDDTKREHRLKQLYSPNQQVSYNENNGVLHYIEIYRSQHQPFCYECMKGIIHIMIEDEYYCNYMINKRNEWLWWDKWLDTFCQRATYMINVNNESLRQQKIQWFHQVYVPLLTKCNIECERGQYVNHIVDNANDNDTDSTHPDDVSTDTDDSRPDNDVDTDFIEFDDDNDDDDNDNNDEHISETVANGDQPQQND